MRLDMRAREGVARLGSNFLKLDGKMRFFSGLLIFLESGVFMTML